MPRPAAAAEKRPPAARRCRIALGCAALLCLPGLAQAETVRVGIDPDYLPFQYQPQEGEATGFDVALLRTIAADQDLSLAVRAGEWQQTLSQLEEGGLDVVPMFITPDRVDRFLFTQPYLRRRHRFFCREGTPEVGSPLELAGATVAVQFGGMAWEWLGGDRYGIRLEPTNVEKGAVEAVARGRADYALVPEDIGDRAVVLGGLGGIVRCGPPVLEADYAFGLPTGREALRDRLDQGLTRAQARGEFDHLRRQWLEPAPGRTSLDLLTWSLAVLAPLALAGLLLLAWTGWRRRHA